MANGEPKAYKYTAEGYVMYVSKDGAIRIEEQARSQFDEKPPSFFLYYLLNVPSNCIGCASRWLLNFTTFAFSFFSEVSGLYVTLQKHRNN